MKATQRSRQQAQVEAYTTLTPVDTGGLTCVMNGPTNRTDQ